MNGIVGPLEEQGFTIGHQLDARIRALGIQSAQALFRYDYGDRNIVFHQNLFRWVEIGAEFISAPGAVAVVTDTQIVADQLPIVELEFVAEETVDPVDCKVLAPAVAPLRPIVTLHCEDQLACRLGKLPDPLVVLIGIFRGGRQELYYRAQRTLRTEDGAVRSSIERTAAVDAREIFL